MTVAHEFTPPFVLAGSWLNYLLYGVEIILSWFYLVNSSPRAFFRWNLVGALLIDSICTAVVSYDVYFKLISNPEDLNSLFQPWMLPTTILCTYHVAALEQVFFTLRYWQMTRSKTVTFLISLILISHIVFAWILAIQLYIVAEVTEFGLTLTIIAAALCAATDLLIAVAMFFTTRSIKSTYSATQSLLQRISLQSIVCGFTTSTFTIIMVSLLVTLQLDWFNLIFYALGRIYTLTSLVNYMLLRKPMAHAISRVSASAQPSTNGVIRSSIAFGSFNNQTFTVPMELSTMGEAMSSQDVESSRPKGILPTQFESEGSSNENQKSFSQT